VVGELDRMTPARQGENLAAALRDSRLVLLSGCGHMMIIEQPDATRDALIDFLVPDLAATREAP
jgi:pimeloyl-ACP methyl ester carboxylesterase